MPPRHAIPSLHNLLADRIWKWILKTAVSTSDPLKLKQFKSFLLSNLNSNIRQTLLNKVMATHMYELDQSNKCYMLELLADKFISTIDLTQKSGYNVLFINEVFQLYRTIVMNNLTKLETLCFVISIKIKQEECYITDVNSIFFRALKQMSSLRKVTVTMIAGLEFVEILGVTCPHLEHLDINYSVNINDECIAKLLLKNSNLFDPKSGQEVNKFCATEIVETQWETNKCCNSLRYLGVNDTEVTRKGILLCLHLLPKLHSFGGNICDGYVSKCISELHEVLPSKKFALTHFWDASMSEIEAQNVKISCPEISFMSTESINSLYCFASLRSLVIDVDFKNVENELLELLSVIGNSLTSLILQDSINTSVDLRSLCEYVPNVEKLTVMLKDDFVVLDKSLILSRLNKATVVVSSSKCLLQFLTVCPSISVLNLKFIKIPYSEDCYCINDCIMISALGQGALKNLEQLSLNECALGDSGLNALIEGCPRLEHIEKLFYWKNLTKLFVEELKAKIKQNNWNLKLVIKEEWGDMEL